MEKGNIDIQNKFCCQRRWLKYGIIFFATILYGAVVTGLVNTSFASLENKFGFSSKTTGIISASSRAGLLFFGLPVAIMAQEKGVPRMRLIAAGLTCVGLGSFFFGLPHYLVKQVESKNNTFVNDACYSVPKGAPDISHSFPYEALFIFGNFLHGVGTAPFFPIGSNILSEIIPDWPQLTALWSSMRVVGPWIGYTVGGLLLRLDTDFDRASTGSASDERDEFWVGAWWIGFPISVALCWTTALVIVLEDTLFVTPKVGSVDLEPASGGVFQRFFAAVVEVPNCTTNLLSNPAFMLTSFGSGVNFMVLYSLRSFMNKFLEKQFHIETSNSAVAVGVFASISSFAGIQIGSKIDHYFGLKFSSRVKFLIFTQAIVFILGFGFLLHCREIRLAGVTHHQMAVKPSYSLEDLLAGCNKDCSCGSKFEPVCGYDNVLYYNACFGGCRERSQVARHYLYSNCSCVQIGDNKAITTPCRYECNNQIYFAIIMTIAMIVNFLPSRSITKLNSDCIGRDKEMLGLAFQQFLGTIMSIIGPFILGAVMDWSCLFKTDKCIIYNNTNLAVSTAAFFLVLKALAQIVFMVSYIFVNKLEKRQATLLQ